MEHVHEQEEWPQTGQKTAFRKRPPHVTHWLDSVVRGFFMTGPPFSCGRCDPGVSQIASPLGAAARPPPMRLPDRQFLSLDLRSLSRSAADWSCYAVLPPDAGDEPEESSSPAGPGHSRPPDLPADYFP